MALRIADVFEGGVHQDGGQGALGEPELANAQIHHLVESRLDSENDKLAAESAGKMHRGLAVADHRDIQQRSNFGQARILHRADGEDIVAFGLRAKGIVEDELNVQRHHVRVDHDLCWGVRSVDAFRHAREGDFDARTGDQACALCQTFEIRWNATAFHQTLIPDAHCKSLHPPGRMR